MKNHDCILGEVIPSKIRLEVYKEALDFIENDKEEYGLNKYDGLCLLLPCITWDLNHFLNKDPNENCWFWDDTQHSFPEFGELIHLITNCIDEEEEVETRIKVLKSCIKILENEDDNLYKI